jgi:hypothetical protein
LYVDYLIGSGFSVVDWSKSGGTAMNQLRKVNLAVLAIASATACATPVRASSIVYTNIQPGDTFFIGVAIGVVPFVGVFNYAGIGFEAKQNYTFERMDLAASLSSGPNVLDVYLMTSQGGLPDQILESFALDNELSTDPTTGMVTIDSVTHPELLAGHEYWVVAAGGPTTTAFWQLNAHGIEGPNVSGPTLTTLQRDANTNDVEALEVFGNGVPEPGSWMLTAGALLVGLAYSRRRLNNPLTPGK